MVMSRYEFLAQAHAIVKPRVYLEVGVQLGPSLALAEAAELAIGIDPLPMVQAHNQRPNQVIMPKTADEHFDGLAAQGKSHGFAFPIDFAFIDGSHLFEDALRDFLNIEQGLSGPGAVVFFDDVLPYNSAIATREQPPGDWTGDVWKVADILDMYRPDLETHLVDVSPTGLLMVLERPPCAIHHDCPTPQPRAGWNADLRADYGEIMIRWLPESHGKPDLSVPDDILNRHRALTAEHALDILRERHES